MTWGGRRGRAERGCCCCMAVAVPVASHAHPAAIPVASGVMVCVCVGGGLPSPLLLCAIGTAATATGSGADCPGAVTQCGACSVEPEERRYQFPTLPPAAGMPHPKAEDHYT